MKRRIRKNIWGNWRGYLGRECVKEFGDDEKEAVLWLQDPERYEREHAEALAQSPCRL